MFNPSVVFLAFANDEKDFLSSLKDESETVYKTLLPVEEKYGSILIRREESAENNDIAYYLGRYKDRLAVFHYAGHADGKLLSFEGKKGNAEGLVNLLALQKNLRLVFLNACATKEQAELYIRAGIKCVIATDLPVIDPHAKLFSTTFYQSLASNSTLEEAYIAAAGALKFNYEKYKNTNDEIIYCDFSDTPEKKEEKKNIFTSSFTSEANVEIKNNVRHVFRKLGNRNRHQQATEEVMPWRMYVHSAYKDVLNWKITEPPIKEYLHRGSLQYFKELRSGRFSYINFKDKTYIKKNGEVRATELADELEADWKENVAHTLIIGKGGTGKTTNTVRIWENYISELNNWSKPIPLYITLSDYNQTDYERNFIIYQIAEHYLGLNSLPSTIQNQLYEVFKKPIIDENGQYVPSFVLMLDGIDEITVDYDQLIDEIEEYSTRFKGIQIVITNTDSIKHRWARDFNRIELVPPRLAITDDFLENSKFTGSSLAELLKNPMMKQLYEEAEIVIARHIINPIFEFKLPVTRRGELMWNHFEVELAKHYETYETIEDGDFLYARYKFLLKHFLPHVAYLMEKKGVLYFDEDQMQEVIKEVSDAIYQRYFLKIFKEYRRFFAYFNLYAEDWVKEEERFELLTLQLVRNFAIFVEDTGKFQFSHQLYRDYLAAVHIRNNIYISLKQYQLPATLAERKLPANDYMWLILGELEGEHYHYSEMTNPLSQRTLLEQTLERCRGIYNRDRIGEVIWNILQIWKELRGNLSGLDLSALDLRGVSLNGVKLQDQDHKHEHPIRLNQTLINRKVFFEGNDRGDVLDVRFSKILKIAQDYGREGYDSSLFFATASSDGTLKLWDITSKRCFTIVDDSDSPITSVDFSPNGRYVVYTDENSMLRMWDLKDGNRAFEEDAHDGTIITCVRFSPDGKFVATSSEDTTIKIWEIRNEVPHLYKTLEKAFPTINCVAFSPDGKLLACGTWDRKVAIWDWEAEELLWLKDRHFSIVTSLAFSPDGQYLVSGSSDDTVFEWKVADGSVEAQYKDHHNGVNSVDYSPDGKWIVSASGDTHIKLWERETGAAVHTLLGHKDYVMSVQFSPDNKYLLSGSKDGTIRLWDLATKANIHTFDNYNGLFVQGCDFQKLHKDSHLQASDTALLKQFGAIFNDNDETIWQDLVDRLCYLFE